MWFGPIDAELYQPYLISDRHQQPEYPFRQKYLPLTNFYNESKTLTTKIYLYTIIFHNSASFALKGELSSVTCRVHMEYTTPSKFGLFFRSCSLEFHIHQKKKKKGEEQFNILLGWSDICFRACSKVRCEIYYFQGYAITALRIEFNITMVTICFLRKKFI